jgi:N-acetylneuraminic acid mutarotase
MIRVRVHPLPFAPFRLAAIALIFTACSIEGRMSPRGVGIDSEDLTLKFSESSVEIKEAKEIVLVDSGRAGYIPSRRSDSAPIHYSANKIFFFGGLNQDTNQIDSSVVYDSSTNTWSKLADMPLPVIDHTATVLPDGKIVIFGGLSGGGGSYNSSRKTQIYDPTTDTWMLGADGLNERYRHTATLLPDGRIFFIGGTIGSGWTVAGTEYYTPSTNSWAAGPPLQISDRKEHVTIALSDRLIVVAGRDDGNNPLGSTEVYTYATGLWTAGGNLTTIREEPAVIKLAGDQVIIIGGSPSGSTAKVEIYDAATNTWTTKTDLNVGRRNMAAILLSDGRVLIAAGTASNGAILKSLEIYSPLANTWTTVSEELAVGRITGHLLFDVGGVIHVIFGTDGGSVEKYNVAANTWDHGLINPRVVRILGANVKLADGRVMAIAGFDGSSFLNSVDIYHPATNSWQTAASASQARLGARAVLLKDGRVLLVGGLDINSGGALIGPTEIYDAVTDTWSVGPTLNVPAVDLEAVVLKDGRIMVYGGVDSILSDDNPRSRIEIFDPENPGLGWVLMTSTLNITFSYPQHHVLDENRVWILSGSDIWYFDPIQDQVTILPSPNITPAIGASILLPDGKILLSGFSANQAGTRIFTPTPTSGSWSNGPDMAIGRQKHSFNILPGNNALVTSGFDAATDHVLDVEFYDAAAGTFTTLSSITGYLPNDLTSNILLDDGRLLLTGSVAYLVPKSPDQIFQTWAPTKPQPINCSAPYAYQLLTGTGHLYDTGLYVPNQLTPETAEIEVTSADGCTGIYTVNSTR